MPARPRWCWSTDRNRVPGLALLPAALRLTAVTGLVALILNAALGAARPAPALVALDASASWLRDGDSSRFRSALERARDEADGALLLFGDSRARGYRGSDHRATTRRAYDRRSSVRWPKGRPLRIYTDGELEDAEALAPLVGWLRASSSCGPKTAPTWRSRSFACARATVGGDTLDVDVALTASVRGGPPSRLTLSLGDRVLSTVSVDSVGAYGERVVRARLPGA